MVYSDYFILIFKKTVNVNRCIDVTTVVRYARFSSYTEIVLQGVWPHYKGDLLMIGSQMLNISYGYMYIA